MKTEQKTHRPKISKVEAKYWKLWRLFCLKKGVKQGDREARMECHKKALGYDKSSRHLTDLEYDEIFFFFHVEINGLEWQNFHKAIADFEGEKRRKIYRILSEAPHAYIQSIASAKFRCADWRNLPEKQLEQLRITVIERARAKRRKQAIKDQQTTLGL